MSLSMSIVDLYSTKSHLLMIDLVVAFVLFIFMRDLLCLLLLPFLGEKRKVFRSRRKLSKERDGSRR